MTQEEKAKRYDEAIIRGSRLWESDMITRENYEYIFPEVKESEDEEIRKDILNYIKHNYNGQHISISRYDSWIAWLERQGKPQVRIGIEWVNTIDDACDKRYSEEYAHGEYCHEQSFKWGFQEGVDWLEKQGEQKTVDEIAKEVCKNKESAVTFLKSTGIINEKGELADEYKIEQDEQNSTWSEEDEDYYDAIIAKLEVTQDDALLTDNQMKFLKSLKDKVQPKQEWSKEDYNEIETIACHLDNTDNEGMAEVLRNIRDKYYHIIPQSTWKPSKEQMEGIECTIKTLRYQLNAGDNRLDSLYNDLKKLREK